MPKEEVSVLDSAVDNLSESFPSTLVDPNKMKLIRNQIDAYVENKEKRDSFKQKIGNLIEEICAELELLLPHAYNFQTGDPFAEDQFLSLLNNLTLGSSFENPLPGNRVSISGPPIIFGNNPAGFRPPEPPLAGGFGSGCFFEPFVLGRIFGASISAGLNSEFSAANISANGLGQVYGNVIETLIERTSPIELIYMTAVQANSSPTSAAQFEKILDFALGLDIQNIRPFSAPISISGTTPIPELNPGFPFPGFGRTPGLSLDICRLQRQEQLAQALRQCVCLDFYQIDNISNLEEGGEALRNRAACEGDLISNYWDG